MSTIPFVKDFDFSYGEADQLSPLVRRLIAENPGPFTYTGSGTYLIGADDEIAVIDPGPYLPAHLERLNDISGGRISHILITHTHFDHCGGARALSEMTGAPIIGFGPHPKSEEPLGDHALEEGGDMSFAPDQEVADGDIIEGTGWRLEALHTPGHLSNHVCFALAQEKALFTGDHVMGWATSVIVPPSGDMADYFNSLDRLAARDDAIYYPTHGAPIKEPQRFVRAIKTHRRIRDGQILEQLKAGPQDIKTIVEAMYADIDKRLHGAAAMNVFAHLIRLVNINAVSLQAGDRPSLDAIYQRTD